MQNEGVRVPSWPLGKATLQKLTSKKYRQQLGLYLLEGGAAVLDAHRLGGKLLGVVHDERALQRESDRSVLSTLEKERVPIMSLVSSDFKRLSDLQTPPPIIAVLVIDEAADPTIPLHDSLVLALDQVSDPGNVGTLLRAAAFYGVREVWLGEGTAELYNPKVLRAAMSAHLHLRVCQQVDLRDAFAKAQKAGAKLHAAVVNGIDAGRTGPDDGPVVLLLGNEPHGIRQEYVEMADVHVAIQRIGPVDSLNVAMAGTVLLDRYLSTPSTGA